MTCSRPALSILAYVAASALLRAETIEFTPRSNIDLLEPWRWHEIEQLNDIDITGGIEDADGNLVLSKNSGLVVFDGYTRVEHPFPEELRIEFVKQLYLTSDQRVLVYTTSGLFRFESGRYITIEQFESPFSETRSYIAANSHGLEVVSTPSGLHKIEGDTLELIPEVTDNLNGMTFDANNTLWITPANTNEVVSYQFIEDRIAKPVARNQYSLQAWNFLSPKLIGNPNSEDVWAVNWRQGVPPSKFNRLSNQWERVDLSSLSGSNAHVGGIRLDDGTLIVFMKTTIMFQHEGVWNTIDYPDFKIPTNSQYCIVRANGNLVIGGSGETAYEIDYASNSWRSYPGLHFQCETTDTHQWFLSLQGGVVEHNPIYDTWVQHTNNVIDAPVSIIRTRDDFIWASGAHRGVPAISYFNGKQWTLNTHPELTGFVSHLSAKQLENGDVVFGSGGDEPPPDKGGIIVYRKGDGRYKHSYHAPTIAPQRPVGITEYGDSLWFGGNGLRRTLSGLTEPATEALFFEGDPWIDHIAGYGDDQLWAAVWDRGLFAFDGDAWIQHSGPEKIRGNQVSYLLNDQRREGSIWIASNRGISRFDGQNWYPNAMPDDLRFNRESGTLMQSKDGSIWVNTATRNWYFRRTTSFNITKQLYENFKSIRYKLDTQPPIVEVTSGSHKVAQPANVFIEWKGFDRWSKTPGSMLRYSYRVGNGDWSTYSTRSNTTLLNVGNGEHRFEVRAMDADGNISARVASANIIVVPTLWQRPWFIATIAFIAFAFLFLVILLYKQKISHIVQLDELKLQFFTNISHELRTPLTVILGPLESQLAKLPPDWDKKPLETAHKNARKMLGLIDQILDFRSAELGNVKFNYSRADLIQCIQETVQLIKPLADERQQTLTIDVDSDTFHAWFDVEKVDKILSNLISNAIKYTHRQGTISVKARVLSDEEEASVTLSVEDNGSGIPQNKIDSIFEVFYRAGNQTGAKVRGSGIGLAYTKNLVELCGGAIEVHSPVTTVDGHDQGSRFTVTLPLKLNPDRDVDSPAEPVEPDVANLEEDERPCILIAEDDEDIRDYINEELGEEYRILTTENGEQGLHEATTRLPELIITDVMMPILDGKEFCRAIKSSAATAHIPVIMLSALKSHEHELAGLERGADDYIAKPIRIDILKQRIHNLLETRARLRGQFQEQMGETRIDPQQVTSNSVDEAFLRKSIETVEAHMRDPLFDVERFAGLMAMSRMTLYRKFKAITGDSPSAFIRSIRLNEAAALLKNGGSTVSEIADHVGITDVSYFSAAFKKRFKKTPSQYGK